MTEEESAEAVRLMLGAHDIKGFRDAEIAKKIAVWSDGWPQHLQNYMCALAGELAEKDSNLANINDAKLRDVGDGDRNTYYSERVQDSRIVDCVTLLTKVAEKIGVNGCSGSELLKILNFSFWEQESDPKAVMPKNMESQELLLEMI